MYDGKQKGDPKMNVANCRRQNPRTDEISVEMFNGTGTISSHRLNKRSSSKYAEG